MGHYMQCRSDNKLLEALPGANSTGILLYCCNLTYFTFTGITGVGVASNSMDQVCSVIQTMISFVLGTSSYIRVRGGQTAL